MRTSTGRASFTRARRRSQQQWPRHDERDVDARHEAQRGRRARGSTCSRKSPTHGRRQVRRWSKMNAPRIARTESPTANIGAAHLSNPPRHVAGRRRRVAHGRATGCGNISKKRRAKRRRTRAGSCRTSIRRKRSSTSADAILATLDFRASMMRIAAPRAFHGFLNGLSQLVLKIDRRRACPISIRGPRSGISASSILTTAARSITSSGGQCSRS